MQIWQILGNAAPYLLAGLATVAALGAVVTSRSTLRRTLEAFQDREERLRSVLNTVPDAIITIDDKGLVTAFSPVAERVFGYRSGEVIGRKVDMLMPHPYRSEHGGYVDRFLTTGEKRIIGIGREVQGMRKDGTVFPMELAVDEIKLGAKRFFNGFARDITDRKLAEAKVREQSRRMGELRNELFHVSRLSELSQMGSVLAHELNQPLTAITNYVQAAKRMMEREKSEVPERVFESMDKASAQAVRAGEIIRRLRQFADKDEGGITNEDVGAVVREACDLGQIGQGEAGVVVEANIESGLTPVLIDRIQVQQVVVNLLRNSLDALAGQRNGHVEIKVSGGDDGGVMVAVIDNGPGMPEDVAKNLFQPFLTTKDDGMGIGLSISRSIVENHGGALECEETPGGGTTFRFTLPPTNDGEAKDAV